MEFLDQLHLPHKFHGSGMIGILFFNFASCKPLENVIAFAGSAIVSVSISYGVTVSAYDMDNTYFIENILFCVSGVLTSKHIGP